MSASAPTDAAGRAGTGLPPVVVSCRGGTPAAQLAEDVVALLAEQGGAEIADPEAVARGEFAGRTVAAVDGCSSACGARLLAAKGVKVDVTLSVDGVLKSRREGAAGARTPRASAAAEAAAPVQPPLDELAAGVAGAIATGRSAPLRHVKPRRPQVPDAPAWTDADGGRGHTAEDYLRAIDALTTPVADCGALATDTPTLAAYVSKALGVTRVSAGAMLQRLEGLGLVERNASKEVLLTAAGRAAADEAVRRLRLLECFVVQFLGYPLPEARAQARTLANSFDADAIERVRASLGDPQRCPHGWPVDPAEARAESHHLVALSATVPGHEAVVMRLAEDDAALVERLAAAGAVPGVRIQVAESGAGPVSFRVQGRDELVVLGEAEATGVIVVQVP